MAFVVGLLLVVVSLDLAKNCKPVNYKFKHYGFEYEYITGCTKGCFLNDTTDVTADPPGDVDKNAGGKQSESAQNHWEIKTCTPCEDIKGNLLEWTRANIDPAISDSERAEWYCNDQITCHWVGGKCKAISCPLIYKKETCGNRHVDDGPDGKKYGWKNDKCSKYELPGDDCKKNCDTQYDQHVNGVDPDDKAGADKTRTQCKYVCDHPDYEEKIPKDRHKYEYTKAERKYSHRVLGCLYALDNQFSNPNYRMTSPVQDGSINTGFISKNQGFGVKHGYIYPSRWSVWAFVLTLVLLILFAVGIIAAIIVLVFVGGSKSSSSAKA